MKISKVYCDLCDSLISGDCINVKINLACVNFNVYTHETGESKVCDKTLDFCCSDHMKQYFTDLVEGMKRHLDNT